MATVSRVRTATLDEPEHGLTDAVLAGTDVLLWWGHMAHGEVRDEIVAKVHARVLDGMGFVGAVGRAELARRDAGERHDVAPAKRGAGRSELFAHGAVEFLGVERAVFADRVAEQEIEERAWRVAEFAVAMDNAADSALEVRANRLVGLAQECLGIRALDFVDMARHGQRLPIREITTALGAIERHLIRPQYDTREAVPRVGDA